MKRTKHARSRATRRGGSDVEAMFKAAAQAAQELGAAAKSAQESWEHIHKARSKANPMVAKAKRAGKKAYRTAKHAVGAR